MLFEVKCVMKCLPEMMYSGASAPKGHRFTPQEKCDKEKGDMKATIHSEEMTHDPYRERFIAESTGYMVLKGEEHSSSSLGKVPNGETRVA